MHILVIDDDDDVREIICVTLNDEGYNVVSASNGKEAFKLLALEDRVDIIITDIVMPEMDGVELIRNLKRDYPHIKILAISGGGHGSAQAYLDAADMLGADLTLCKPFVRQELLDALNKLFDHK